MAKKLTHEFIAMRTKCDRLESIKNLNLWGNDLEDISILKTMQNLEVLSLSVNKIRTLKDLSNLKNLRELYLRKNNIADINEVRYLTNLHNLKILWLSENPVAEVKNYRNIVIKNLPQISKLDDNVITLEERESLSQDEGNTTNNNYQDDRSIDDELIYDAGKNDENVFENNTFAYENESRGDKNYLVQNMNNPNNNNYNEIYSNNEKNKKLKDKFSYQNSNNNYNNANNSNEIKKKNTVNVDDNLVNNFENLKIKKRNTTANLASNITPNVTNVSQYENKQEIKNDIVQTVYNKNSNNNRKCSNNDNIQSSRSTNILNCVLILLKELGENELDIVKNEIDKKLSKY